MAKYVLAYHGGGGMPQSAEEQEKIMADWGAWFASLGDDVLDGGNPISAARTVTSDGSVVEGGGANALTGYSLINADSLDAAVEKASSCPVLAAGGSVEVAEAIAM